ncbi:hypothetical protein GCK72_019141 [Caenorhabditis remanei]|uniref:Uncharacterized protein n=1 Tax=Caenorhabditis remanei TaxID=31234 RepID=A0A6A5GCQ9_CAERE|nr:hypothetical protein GCK72_019141 [Caenorhabditis remanei]KAF1752586.1 hypothetical protein GCK72_019141 [Caenorhabditis remanei]
MGIQSSKSIPTIAFSVLEQIYLLFFCTLHLPELYELVHLFWRQEFVGNEQIRRDLQDWRVQLCFFRNVDEEVHSGNTYFPHVLLYHLHSYSFVPSSVRDHHDHHVDSRLYHLDGILHGHCCIHRFLRSNVLRRDDLHDDSHHHDVDRIEALDRIEIHLCIVGYDDLLLDSSHRLLHGGYCNSLLVEPSTVDSSFNQTPSSRAEFHLKDYTRRRDAEKMS